MSKHVRPSVWSFALRMEEVLARHDASKGGQQNWRKDHIDDLFERLRDEVLELGMALKPKRPDMDDVDAESVDVANFALMVSDKARPLADDDGSEIHGCSLEERELLDRLYLDHPELKSDLADALIDAHARGVKAGEAKGGYRAGFEAGQASASKTIADLQAQVAALKATVDQCRAAWFIDDAENEGANA